MQDCDTNTIIEHLCKALYMKPTAHKQGEQETMEADCFQNQNI